MRTYWLLSESDERKRGRRHSGSQSANTLTLTLPPNIPNVHNSFNELLSRAKNKSFNSTLAPELRCLTPELRCNSANALKLSA